MELFLSNIKQDKEKEKNEEMMREVIHKALAKESAPYWRKK